MSEVTLSALADEVKKSTEKLMQADEARRDALAELKTETEKKFGTVGEVQAKLDRIAADQTERASDLQTLKTFVDDLAKKVDRPNGSLLDQTEVQKRAQEYARLRHTMLNPTLTNEVKVYDPSKEDLERAELSENAMRKYIRLPHQTDMRNFLSDAEHKAMTAFTFSNNSFILSPMMSNEIISCLIDRSDTAGLFSSMSISKGSVKFLLDNVEFDTAAWACETNCFANNPKAALEKGLGEVEIKAETLRYSLCASRELLDDSDVNIESWMRRKVNMAFRHVLSQAFMTGDGNGKPIGVLNKLAGIPTVLPDASTPAGEFTWQDLIMLKWQTPVQYHKGARYLMNQYTMGQVLTMADANGRPIMINDPTEAGRMLVNGSPITIVTQMPNVATGATPVAFGNWEEAYRVVYRRGLSFQRDDYSAGYCVIYKFETRIGGGILCPNAARLLQIS